MTAEIEQTEAARPRGTRLPRAVPDATSSSAPPRKYSLRRGITRPPWTASPSARASASRFYEHFPGKLDLYLALLDQHCESLLHAVRTALASTTDEFVASAPRWTPTSRTSRTTAVPSGSSSDLTNEPAVRERVDKVTHECAEAICEVIAEDTGLSRAESMLLAFGPGRPRTGGGPLLAAQRPQRPARPGGAAADVTGLAGYRGVPAARHRSPLTHARRLTPDRPDRVFVPVRCSLLAFSAGTCTCLTGLMCAAYGAGETRT